MKFVEELRGIYEGEEIWVIGSGPSMDEYPIDFFKGKVCVGANWSFTVFQDIGDGIEKFSCRDFYSVHEHVEPADWIVEHIPHFLKKCIFLLPPMRIQTGRSKMVWWEDYNDDPYYMRWGLCGPKRAQATDKDFKVAAECIMARRDDCKYVCRGTTLHWAIQAAIVFGGRKIYLVGASTYGGYMRKHGALTARVPTKYGKRTEPWRTGTKALAAAFRPYGVEMVRYYYGKGEEAI